MSIELNQMRMADTWGWEPTAFGIATEAIGIVDGVVALLIYACTVLWVYQSASEARMIPVLWAVIAIFCNVLAIPALLVVRSLIRRKCPECGAYAGRKDRCCPGCGHSFVKRCASCGKDADEHDRFCPGCGASLG